MDLLFAIRVFARVAETGGFARAADAMEMSRTMVTTRIAQLEAHLGVRLLARTTRRVALTDEGRAYYERALRILADVTEAEEAVGNRGGAVRGRLRVAMPGAFAHLVLIPALPRLLARHPELTLELVVDERALDLVQEGLDCAVRAAAVREGDLVARRIGTARFVTCAAPAYLTRRGSPSQPVALEGHDCIGWLAPGGSAVSPWMFEQGGEPIRVAPASRVALSTMAGAVEAAVQGLGVAHVFSSVAHGPIVAGQLRPLLTDWTPPGPPVSVVYAGSRYLSAKVRAFAEFAAEIFPTESWWRDILAVAAKPGARKR